MRICWKDGAQAQAAGVPLPATTTPFERDDTAGSGLDQGTIDALKQGGAACNTNVIYPYGGTVFPNGVISPPFQWEGAAEAAHVRVGKVRHQRGEGGRIKHLAGIAKDDNLAGSATRRGDRTDPL